MTDPPYSIEEALEMCLARMSAGETAEACQRDFPQHADELAPMLAAAQALREWSPPRLSARGRQAAHARASAALRPAPRRSSAPWGIWAFRLVAATLVGALLLGGGVAFAGDSLPGSPLYPLKRAGESAQLAIAGRGAGRVIQSLILARHRVEEIVALAQAGREVDARLLDELSDTYGIAAREVAAADPDQRPGLLVLYDVQVMAQRDTLLRARRGDLTDAARQSLDGARRASAVADAILLDAGLRPKQEPTPAPMATAAATDTARPTATDTARPTATDTARPTALPTDTARPTAPPPTRTPRPVAAPTEAPTAAPTEAPTAAPTEAPTAAPTEAPTAAPTPSAEEGEPQPPEPRRTAGPDDRPPLATEAPEPRGNGRPAPESTDTPAPSSTGGSEQQEPRNPEPEHTKQPEPEDDHPDIPEAQATSQPPGETSEPEEHETAAPDDKGREATSGPRP